MCRLFSPNSEILLLALLGLATAVIEAMYLNLHEKLQDAWKVGFPEDMLPVTVENMLKTVISGIIIARGVTVHIYLASFLLLFFPVLKERRRILILVWLTVSGLRAILVNGLAALVGIAICSCLPEPHPACFEFLTTKGAELACSVFMWVIVNDFMYYLRKKPYQSVEVVAETVIGPRTTGFPKGKWQRRGSFLSEQDSEESASSITESVNAAVAEVSEGSSDSLVAKAAVNWFFRLSLGMKSQSRKADRDEELTQKFLHMTPEEVERLTQKIKQILAKNAARRESDIKIDPDEPGPSHQNKWTVNPDIGITIKSREVVRNSINSIFQDDRILPTTAPTIASESVNADLDAPYRNAGTQTDKLPKKILRIIERQEQVIKENGLNGQQDNK